MDVGNRVRGPSWMPWPVLDSSLYLGEYLYQIKIQAKYDNESMRSLLSQYNLLGYQNVSLAPYFDYNIIGFKQEPSEEFLAELQLRFG